VPSENQDPTNNKKKKKKTHPTKKKNNKPHQQNNPTKTPPHTPPLTNVRDSREYDRQGSMKKEKHPKEGFSPSVNSAPACGLG